MGDKIVRMDDHRPAIVIVCDDGSEYTYLESHLTRVADGQADLATLAPEALRSIIGQWLCFVDVIAEFAEEEDGG